MPELTKRLVDAAEARSTEYFVWDSESPGFGLRVLPSGRKGYVVQYRAGRRSRRISLGPSTVLTCEQARTRAIAIAAARLLILTGCRLNEIMSLEWSSVDLDLPALRLPDSKTGAKVVQVGQPVVDLLRGAQRIDGDPWVIAGTLPGKRPSDLQPFWQRVRARAGVKDVRIHDLRHTFASTAVASGQGLPMIGKLPGHAQVQTTARYAHLAAEPVRMAADAVAQNLRQSLG